MNQDKILNPYSLSTAFRAYVYDAVVLATETKRVNISSLEFQRSTLFNGCGLNVLMVEHLDEVQLHDFCPWPEGEFFIFHKGKGGGYAVLFKRLRDTFAHGDFGSSDRDWVTIRHRYKGPREEEENTRAFGKMRIITLKKLVTLLDTASSDAGAGKNAKATSIACGLG